MFVLFGLQVHQVHLCLCVSSFYEPWKVISNWWSVIQSMQKKDGQSYVPHIPPPPPDQSFVRLIPPNTSLQFSFQITTFKWHHGNSIQINLHRSPCWTDIEMDCPRRAFLICSKSWLYHSNKLWQETLLGLLCTLVNPCASKIKSRCRPKQSWSRI